LEIGDLRSVQGPRSRRDRRFCPWAIVAVGAAAFLFGAVPAHAYIGPGAGFAVLGSFLTMAAALVLGGVVLLTWPLKLLLRRRQWRRIAARSQARRVVVLGLDGLDPGITEQMMAAGRLPNLARLREQGTYRPLATTCPAMSPVAWSSFSTGTGPGRHGIFDFLHRDPRTYLPDLSSTELRPPRRGLRLGPWWIPLSRPTLRLLRRSKAFWTVLGENGIFSTVLRVPITFPPERFRGLLLSGMCVPDLRGTQGSFTFCTTAPDKAARIGGEHAPLTREGRGCRGELAGPPRPGAADGAPARLRFRLEPLRDGRARLTIDGQRVTLTQGEYSDWTPVSFRLAPGMRATGICRFLLKSASPEVELYVSPINVDPDRPSLPISHPAIYATYLAKRLGRFATLGLAEDTWALNEGVLDDAAFLTQCRLFFAERERMLMNALANQRHGCIVCVFDTTDRVQHMFWRAREADHPANAGAPPEGDPIAEIYEEADALVGRVAAQVGSDDVLMVMSDHGFASFRRGVNVNAWLREHGYLTLKEGASGEAEWLRDVDWSRTRAYALGLGGLYLNLRGREAQGIVPPGEAAALKRELIEGLTAVRDGDRQAIPHVFETAEADPGPYSDVGPDLIVGYAPGYRASWEAAQGKAGGPVISDNTRRWSGDHCLDPELVPGVLFCSRPLGPDEPRITDIAPTILALFGVPVPHYMEGRPLLGEGAGDAREQPEEASHARA
jgi:predicted AlkP superfamily phosphohydrolase/phosphomutase